MPTTISQPNTKALVNNCQRNLISARQRFSALGEIDFSGNWHSVSSVASSFSQGSVLLVGHQVADRGAEIVVAGGWRRPLAFLVASSIALRRRAVRSSHDTQVEAFGNAERLHVVALIAAQA